METQIVEVRRHVTIPLNIIANKGTYTFTINNVDFIPDEVTLKYINYSTAAAGELGVTTLIQTDLVPDTNIFGSFAGNVAIQPNTTFTLRKPIKGVYTFNMLTITGVIEDGRVGEFAMHLEFIKYRTSKQDKIY